MTTAPPIVPQLAADPDAALTRVRLALIETNSIPDAAHMLGCSAPWLRKVLAAHPQTREGISLTTRGYPKGAPREGRRGRAVMPENRRIR